MTLPLTGSVFQDHKNQVAVTAHVNDVEGLRFLVDTALDPSALDVEVARQAGLSKRAAEGSIEGVGSDDVKAWPAVIDRFSALGEAPTQLDVLVMDMASLSRGYGAKLDGVMGYSWLKSRHVVIDYPSSHVISASSSRTAQKMVDRCKKSFRFPLRFISDEDRLIIIPHVRVGNVEAPAFLDTGSSAYIRLEIDAPVLMPLRPLLASGQSVEQTGARGKAKATKVDLPVPISIGPFSVPHTEANLVEQRISGAPILIGNAMLRQLEARILVDMPARQIGIFAGCGAMGRNADR